MHLRNVEIFCDVAARRSFSKAAAAHGVSQSLASQAVGVLEKRLGVLLIDRSKRPLELTAAGGVYFEGCRKVLDSLRSVEDEVQKMRDKVAGQVRVAAIYSVGLLEMERYIKKYEAAYPDVDLRVDYLHPERVYEHVLNDTADVGIVSFPRDGGEISSIDWQAERMVVVVPSDHRLAVVNEIPVSELTDEPFVAFTTDLTVRRRIDQWLRSKKVAIDVVREFDNVETIKRAVEVGAGVTLLPYPTIRREVELGSLHAIELTDVSWTRPLGFVHKRHRTLTTAASRFIELLHEEFPSFETAEESTVIAGKAESAKVSDG